MEEYELAALERRLDAGEALEGRELGRVVADLRAARRAAMTPTEFVVRVARLDADPDH